MPYAVGTVLILGICVLHVGGHFSNDPQEVIQSGLVMAPFFFLILAPVHLALQWLAGRVFTRFLGRGLALRTAVLNLPAAAALIVCLKTVVTPWSAGRLREAFQAHFEFQLPASTQVLRYRMRRGMNEGRYAFAVRINPDDLDELLTRSNFRPVALDSDEASLVMLESTGAAALVGTPPTPWAIRRSEERIWSTRVTKTILVHSNRADLLFIDDFR